MPYCFTDQDLAVAASLGCETPTVCANLDALRSVIQQVPACVVVRCGEERWLDTPLLGSAVSLCIDARRVWHAEVRADATACRSNGVATVDILPANPYAPMALGLVSGDEDDIATFTAHCGHMLRGDRQWAPVGGPGGAHFLYAVSEAARYSAADWWMKMGRLGDASAVLLHAGSPNLYAPGMMQYLSRLAEDYLQYRDESLRMGDADRLAMQLRQMIPHCLAAAATI